ncbi:hypothetical protein [Aquamicrobium defluvii]|nr:hypothetical protein [Aquamicrobium defluvii]
MAKRQALVAVLDNGYILDRFPWQRLDPLVVMIADDQMLAAGDRMNRPSR